VTITATHFTSGIDLEVTFGDEQAKRVTVLSDSALLVTPAAPLAPGFVDVTVSHSEGSATAHDGFAWTPALRAEGPFTIGASFTLELLLTRLDAVIAYYGMPPEVSFPVAGFGGALCVGRPLILLTAPAWPSDSLNLVVDVPDDPALVGLTCLFQGVAGDDLRLGGSGGFTDCVSITLA